MSYMHTAYRSLTDDLLCDALLMSFYRCLQMRQRAVSMYGSAFRTLSMEAALGLLCMQGTSSDSLMALLKSCSENGIESAQRALSAAQMGDAAGRQVLVFHA